MTSSKAPRNRNGRSKQGRRADAVELNGSSDIDDRPQSRPRPPLFLFLPLLSLLTRLVHLLSSWRIFRKWRSTRLRGRAFGAALHSDDSDDGDEQSRRKTAVLPTDVGLVALRLANCRDLASACSPELITPGRLFRSASPFAVGGGEAEEEAAARTLSGASASGFGSSFSFSSSRSRGLNLALVIDLRSANEWEAGRGDEVLRALAGLCKNNKESNENKSQNETLPRVERVALQEWKRYTYAFVARLPPARSLGAAAHFLLFRGLLRLRPPIPGMHARLCADAERGGLLAMYTTVLASFPHQIARLLRLVLRHFFSDPLSSVMVACKLGKDRTGLVSALCLAVAGASRREVVRDYSRSAVELAGRPPPATAPSLGGAPRAAMERTLDWLSEHFAGFADEGEVEQYREREEERKGRTRRKREGSENGGSSSLRRPCSPCWRAGVLGYLEREARFVAAEREALRRALTE